MEVFVSPTFSIDVSSPSPYDVPPHDEHRVVVPPPLPSLFLEEEAEGRAEKTLISRRIGSDFGVGDTEDSSGSSSSIGAPDDSDEEEDDSVVSSSNAGLGSLDSLEDSLPIKRGLSNHCCGKSKSFANLSDVSWALGSAKDLEKPENPFNKRRRILMANKRSRKSSSFYSWHDNPKSMPLLASLTEEDDDVEVQEEEEEEEEDDDEEDQESPVSWSSSSSSRRRQEDHEKLGVSPKAQMGSKFKRASFKSQSSFSLPGLEFQRHK